MGKLEDMLRDLGANVGESMGEGRLSGAVPRAPRPPLVDATPARLQGLAKMKDAMQIPVDKIQPDPDQPRAEFDAPALDRLAESLRTRGQLQPIRVRWDEDRGVYVILCGERRWRAAVKAGLTMMTCVIAEGTLTAGAWLELQLIENCLREDLKPIEQAKAFQALMDRNGWSVRALARQLAIDHSGVVRAVALLELPSSVQAKIEQGTLPPATAYEISKAPDPAIQEDLAERVAAEGLTRSAVAEAVRARKAPRPKPRRVEYATRSGVRITATLPLPEQGEEAILAALQEVLKELRRAKAPRPEAA
jgi:ParB family transcriptional regulator, chromosome partitioning protein